MDQQRSLFPKHLAHPDTEIIISEPTPSTWVIDEKLSEHVDQYTERDVQYGLGPSYTNAKFSCRNVANPAERGFMRIYLQIPDAGSELDPPSERAQRATFIYHIELEALETFTAKRSNITPTLLAPVPGGYMTIIVWNVLPGKCMGDSFGSDAFLALEDAEREAVKEAFISAYTYATLPLISVYSS